MVTVTIQIRVLFHTQHSMYRYQACLILKDKPCQAQGMEAGMIFVIRYFG